MTSQKNIPFKVWPSMRPVLSEPAAYILDHHEEWVRQRGGRPPSGRPFIVWPDGRCRIEFGGNFSCIEEAAARIRSDLSDPLQYPGDGIAAFD